MKTKKKAGVEAVDNTTKDWMLTRGHGELADLDGCDEVFALSNGTVTVYLVEGLKMRRSSNIEFPFIIEAHGGATVKLTYEQMAYLMLEYMRYQTRYAKSRGGTVVERKTVAFHGSIKLSDKYEDDDGEEDNDD